MMSSGICSAVKRTARSGDRVFLTTCARALYRLSAAVSSAVGLSGSTKVGLGHDYRSHSIYLIPPKVPTSYLNLCYHYVQTIILLVMKIISVIPVRVSLCFSECLRLHIKSFILRLPRRTGKLPCTE